MAVTRAREKKLDRQVRYQRADGATSAILAGRGPAYQ